MIPMVSRYSIYLSFVNWCLVLLVLLGSCFHLLPLVPAIWSYNIHRQQRLELKFPRLWYLRECICSLPLGNGFYIPIRLSASYNSSLSATFLCTFGEVTVGRFLPPPAKPRSLIHDSSFLSCKGLVVCFYLVPTGQSMV